jgi:uncharacterized protein
MNMNIVDRRANPKGKSLSNRQRFLARARVEVKSAVQEALRKRKVADVGHGEKVAIPTRGITEPIFHHNRRTGRTDHVVPGNKEYLRGDEIPRPNGGEGQGGREGSPDGGGEDAFEFTLTREEFLDMFFEDLELPDLIKKSLKDTTAVDLQRAGYTVTGTPANLSVPRTMRNSMGRRIALRRPKLSDMDALRAKVEEARARGDDEEAERLGKELERIERRSKIIPYIDPIDVRYRRFDRVPKPNTEAVMFCLMDVSGSMTEHMKDLAKRFYTLLYVFLKRRYRHVEIVFIRHTDRAEEVDEDTFFHGPASGGTLVSSALQEMHEIVRSRFRPADWNIYAAQASDGDNSTSDGEVAGRLLTEKILPVSQFFAYLEVGQDAGLTFEMPDSSLWTLYERLRLAGAPLSMRKVCERSEIFPVFHDLFQRRTRQERAS